MPLRKTACFGAAVTSPSGRNGAFSSAGSPWGGTL